MFGEFHDQMRAVCVVFYWFASVSCSGVWGLLYAVMFLLFTRQSRSISHRFIAYIVIEKWRQLRSSQAPRYSKSNLPQRKENSKRKIVITNRIKKNILITSPTCFPVLILAKLFRTTITTYGHFFSLVDETMSPANDWGINKVKIIAIFQQTVLLNSWFQNLHICAWKIFIKFALDFPVFLQVYLLCFISLQGR